MNLRTLKKLSKRAAPLLPKLGDRREQFATAKGEGSLSHLITARKHWDRSICGPGYEPWNNYSTSRGMPMKQVTRAGRTIVIRPPSEPRKGTVMVGCVSGYYEPEWSEETAWEALTEAVYWHFAEFDDAGELVTARSLRSPSDVLRAAGEILSEGGRPCA
jgi:hypothetical protein